MLRTMMSSAYPMMICPVTTSLTAVLFGRMSPKPTVVWTMVLKYTRWFGGIVIKGLWFASL